MTDDVAVTKFHKAVVTNQKKLSQTRTIATVKHDTDLVHIPMYIKNNKPNSRT